MVKKSDAKNKISKPKRKASAPRKIASHKHGPVLVKEEKPSKKVVKGLGYIFAVGRRKEAVARVRLFDGGKGDFEINKVAMTQYFPNFEYQLTVLAPLKALGVSDKFNITVKVQGGGKTGQADAVRLGIARALLIHNPEWRPTLKPFGFLTRDARVKERKKAGLKKARRAPQWQKR